MAHEPLNQRGFPSTNLERANTSHQTALIVGESMTSESVSSRKIRQLHRSHMRDAALDEVYIVLSVEASLISTLGLLANSPAW